MKLFPADGIESIDIQDCNNFLASHHYADRFPQSKYRWGWYEGGELCGVITYSIPASYTLCKGVCGEEYKREVLELSRLALDGKLAVRKNKASQIIAASFRELRKSGPWILVSYADPNDHINNGAGHVGYVYQATNWIYTGQGNAEPKWINPVDGTVVSYTRRHIDKKAAKLGLDWQDLGKEKQKGKHRYVNFIGNRREVRERRRLLRYPPRPYPKSKATP